MNQLVQATGRHLRHGHERTPDMLFLVYTQVPERGRNHHRGMRPLKPRIASHLMPKS
ncbi:hypothetical protein THZG08_80062 [Vibrio owensii]|uniref:Uncharacterized protein n=1 Tax=Vibrio owensii TaxID=696485 RepID=A0AAU9Q5B9_9VIBR|nr:hypothetical protein THF1D04_20519 [Vibrio owensii]CAH1540348.1 hypothetical protein THZG08_80062 [Vibrio owensii]CAH1592393.1 hypothetical protein THOA03_80062 [Vibrio owensii]